MNMETEIGTGAHMMMIITLLEDPSPHLLVMIGSTDHTGDLQVLRGMVEAHPGLIHTDHITILQIPRGMAGAPEGPVPTGDFASSLSL